MHKDNFFLYSRGLSSTLSFLSCWTENAHSMFSLSSTVSLETLVHAADSFLKKKYLQDTKGNLNGNKDFVSARNDLKH